MQTSATMPIGMETKEAAAFPTSTAWISRIVMLGATAIVVGIYWDISWHRTIGRDTFWTPAHLAIQLGGLLGGLTAGWLVLRTTFFGTVEDRARAVKLWGFYGPFGAWVTIWGCLAMLTSAPFDNWWHDAYGLDVKIISPPHAVLAVGMWSVVGGCLLLVLRQQNNSAEQGSVPVGQRVAGRWFYIYGAGVLVAMASVFLTELSWPNDQHTHRFFTWSAATYPFYLVGLSRASKFRWGATLIAAVYMLVVGTMCWTLPLFEGHPKLGPIYHQVDHFVPLPFPMLLVIPAFAIDLIRNVVGQGRAWWRDGIIVLVCAAAFVALFAVTQWHFSKFLLTPHAENWFFAADRHWGYTESLGPWRKQFWDTTNPTEHAPATMATWMKSFALALVASTLGLTLGNWMAKVRR
jgi:hypothetical protein